MGLAKQDLEDLKNTDIFKYSPYKALPNDQKIIVKELADELKSNNNFTFLVSGSPGTGKTIVAIYLIKYLIDREVYTKDNIALVVPMTSLRKTIKKVFRDIHGLSSSMVIGPSDFIKKNYDLLIVDEAHRLRRRNNITNYISFDTINHHFGLDKNGNELDWIKLASNKQVFFYDKNQTVRPSDVSHENFSKLHAKQFTLKNQHRVLGGNKYINFIDQLFDKKDKPPDSIGFKNFDLQIFDNVQDLVHAIKQKEKDLGLSRIVAGYAWPWITRNKNTNANHDIQIGSLKLKWNSTNSDWVNSKNAINEVGCIHTVQGYDLNYVGVIIGPELKMKNGQFIIDKAHYFDINGHRGIKNDEILKAFILNIYKTLLTRGIHGTYIYAVDEELRNYLKSHINEHAHHKNRLS